MALSFNNLDLPSVLSTLVPVTLFFVCKLWTFGFQSKALIFYLLISLAIDATSFLGVYSPTNSYILNAFTYIEFVCIIYIYQQQWNNKKMTNLFRLAVLAFTLCFILTCFFTGRVSDINGYITTLEAVLISITSIWYFFELLNSKITTKLTAYYFFWFNTAFLIYFSVVLFVFLFINQILNPAASQPVKNLWLLHNAFHIIYNCLLGIGIYTWKKART